MLVALMRQPSGRAAAFCSCAALTGQTSPVEAAVVFAFATGSAEAGREETDAVGAATDAAVVAADGAEPTATGWEPQPARATRAAPQAMASIGRRTDMVGAICVSVTSRYTV